VRRGVGLGRARPAFLPEFLGLPRLPALEGGCQEVGGTGILEANKRRGVEGGESGGGAAEKRDGG